MQITKKAVYADFLHLKERPEVVAGQLSIPLGEPTHAPDILKLHEGDEVLLIDPGSFHAQGWVHIIERNGVRWYYGVLDEEPQEDQAGDAVVFYA